MAEWFEEFDEGLWLGGEGAPEEEAAFLKRALRLRKGQTVLDVPCGDGRIALELAKAGLLVMGIDHNPYFVKAAWERFREEELEGEFCVADMRELAFVECFHGALNWGGSFGYFSEEENLEVVRHLARAVRPGGRVLIDQPNREYILRHFVKERRRGNVTVVNRWDARRERIKSTWTLRRRRQDHEYPMSIRLYTAAQFRRLFKRAGLEVEATYDSTDGSDFGRGSRRLAVVGRKPKK
jgi:SAM-dependent methyltransferase